METLNVGDRMVFSLDLVKDIQAKADPVPATVVSITRGADGVKTVALESIARRIETLGVQVSESIRASEG